MEVVSFTLSPLYTWGKEILVPIGVEVGRAPDRSCLDYVHTILVNTPVNSNVL
jgi:hypothetical protein